jgi:hypothetical protein
LKPNLTILFLSLLYCLTTSLQCNKCHTGDLHLDATKSWFPLKGKTQLTFRDDAGNSTDLKLHVVDTTEIATNPDCGTSYRYEYITTSLYLNPAKSDSIFFSLASNGWLCMNATTGNNQNIVMCNVFGQTKEGIIARRLYNQTIGSRTYAETILLLHNQGFSDNIDSVFIANNAGIVGFKYATRRYSLQ